MYGKTDAITFQESIAKRTYEAAIFGVVEAVVGN